MSIRTVGDLRQFMKETGLSPEAVARATKISNMTFRRLLRKPDTVALAEKYHPLLDRLAGPIALPGTDAASEGFAQLISDLEAEGSRGIADEELRARLRKKKRDRNVPAWLWEQTRRVAAAAFSPNTPLRTRAICIGALLYFINPVDLIPDALPGVGYLDDLSVLTLVVGMLAKPTVQKE